MAGKNSKSNNRQYGLPNTAAWNLLRSFAKRLCPLVKDGQVNIKEILLKSLAERELILFVEGVQVTEETDLQFSYSPKPSPPSHQELLKFWQEHPELREIKP